MTFWWHICTDERFLYMYKGFGFSCHIVPCVAGIRHRLGYGVGKRRGAFLGSFILVRSRYEANGRPFFLPVNRPFASIT